MEGRWEGARERGSIGWREGGRDGGCDVGMEGERVGLSFILLGFTCKKMPFFGIIANPNVVSRGTCAITTESD